jgi:SPW repeat
MEVNMMTKLQEKLAARWQDALNLLLGLWLAVSPWALSYMEHTMAHWNAHATGVAIAVVAAAALIASQTWEEWVNTILAVWLIASPWILGFSELQAATWNQVAVGVLVGGLALCSAATTSDTGGLAMKS